MRDYGLVADETLPPADRAAKYLLDRIQYDVNLRQYLSAGTEAFMLLCEAEAARTGEDVGTVSDRRVRDLRSSNDRGKSTERQLRRRIQNLEEELGLAEGDIRNPDMVYRNPASPLAKLLARLEEVEGPGFHPDSWLIVDEARRSMKNVG